MYHYVTVVVVMRDCESIEDAEQKCGELLPQNPDDNTTYMESWEITKIVKPNPNMLDTRSIA